MPFEATREERFSQAEQILADWLAKESPSALAGLLAAHPDLEPELRELGEAMGILDGAIAQGRERLAAERVEIERVLSDLGRGAEFGPRYSIETEVGKGGMGAVFRVLDKKLGRPLAMKVILGQADASRSGKTPGVAPAQLQRFLNEARITGQLQHPGIVPVHEVGVDGDGRAYFTMKLVQGRTLGEVFRRQRAGEAQWSRTRVVSLLQRVCEALAYAHAQSVVHRDLKPGNVMVGDHGEVYVMDWGLARRLGDGAEPAAEMAVDEALSAQVTLTRDGAVVGTPAYMPPEQAAGRIAEVGPAADVYAIGAMLYELIAGHAPYCGPGEDSSGSAVLRRIVAGEPAPLVASKKPPELVAIITKAMAHDWRKRYASVQELEADLGALVEQRVVRAYASGPWAEMRQWTRRNRGVAAGIATTLAALIAGIIGTTTQAATATAMTREAVKQASTKETALEFLVQAFQQVDPARSGGVFPRSDDVLKTAVGQLAQVGDPEARCVIAASLAEIYMHLGEPALAREILLETLSAMSSLHVKPAEACYVWNQLASACVELDRFDEADEIYKKLRDLFAASPSLADRWQYGLDANYGNLLVKTGRATEAEPLLRRAVAHASQSHGPDAAKTMAVRNNMASCLASLSRHSEAVAEYKHIIAILEGRDNDRGPRLLWAKMALAQSLWQIGRQSEAMATVKEVDAVVVNLGDLGIEGIQLRVNAATMLGTCGAHTEAVARLVQMMPSASAALPKGHGTLRSLLRNLGHSLCALSDFEGASKAYEQVLPLDREAEGDSGLGTISSQLGLAWVEVHRAGGANLETAAGHYEQILHACASVRDSRGHEIASARGGLGLVRLRQGHPEKAEPLLQEALADRRRLNPRDPRIEKILVLLVDCQRRLGRVAEAMSSVDELIATTPPDSPELVARRALREELLLERRR